MREEILVQRTIITEGCWFWQGYKMKGGYGTVYHAGRNNYLAHRWSYEHFIGPIPEGLHIDHLCGHRDCLNPFHMEPVTLVENVLRGSGVTATNARKTHCKYGHAFDAQNTYILPSGGRHCRACRRRWDAERRNAIRRQSHD